ncbi:MAG TPA: HAMP domain-containing protein [Alphaproteobacteria bacterium]|nr:HAMP domain-containing protein [Alphaproteobacteria bacterium]
MGEVDPERPGRFSLQKIWVCLPFAVKLALSTSVLISLVMLLLGALIIENQNRLLERNMHAFGRTVLQQVVESAKEPLLANDGLLLQVLASSLTESEQIIGTELYSSEHGLLARAGISPFQPGAPIAGRGADFLDENEHTLDWEWFRLSGEKLEAMTFTAPVRFRDTRVGFAAVTLSRELMTSTLRESVRSIATVTLSLLAVAITLSWFVGRRLARPIRNLMAASRAIGHGNFDYRFTERRADEVGHLMQAFNSMAEGLLQKRQVEAALSRYLPPEVARRVVEGLEPVELGGTQAQGSVMFVDIVDFTARAEALPPEAVAALLNEFYSSISTAAGLYQGTVDKYMGDCAMVVFGVPEADPDHVFHAIACAVFFQRLAERLNAAAGAGTTMRYRIGLNSGDMLAGNIGTQQHVQYTVVGDSVNLASRLCAVATAGQIVINEQMLGTARWDDRLRLRPFGSIRIRGKSKPVSTYLVEGLAPAYEKRVREQIAQVLASTDSA